MKSKSSLIQYFLLFFFLSIGLYLLDQGKLIQNVRVFLEKQIFKIAERNIDEKEAEIETLKAKSASAEAELARIKKENDLLRKQLQAPLPSSFKFLPVKVVSLLDNEQKERRLTIFTRGEKEVEKGLPVVLENVLIGKIEKVGAAAAAVILLSDKESKIAAKTAGGARGLAVGGDEETTTIYLERILQKEMIKIGDKIVTSGEDGLPPDFLIGEVVEVLVNDQDPFKTAKVKLFVDPEKVVELFVVKVE